MNQRFERRRHAGRPKRSDSAPDVLRSPNTISADEVERFLSATDLFEHMPYEVCRPAYVDISVAEERRQAHPAVFDEDQVAALQAERYENFPNDVRNWARQLLATFPDEHAAIGAVLRTRVLHDGVVDVCWTANFIEWMINAARGSGGAKFAKFALNLSGLSVQRSRVRRRLEDMGYWSAAKFLSLPLVAVDALYRHGMAIPDLDYVIARRRLGKLPAGFYWSDWQLDPTIRSPHVALVTASRDDAMHLTLDATHVYWTRADGTIMRVAKDGGLVECVAQCQPSLRSARGDLPHYEPLALGVDSSGAYWSSFVGIFRYARGEYASGLVMPGPAFRLALDASSLYWSDGRRLLRSGKNGTHVDMLVPQNGREVSLVGVSDESVYWTDGKHLHRRSKTEGVTRSVVVGQFLMRPFACVQEHAYWFDRSQRVVAWKACDVTPRVVTPSHALVGLASPISFGDYMYWTAPASWLDGGRSIQGSILRVNSRGREETVVEAAGDPYGIAVDKSGIYVAERWTGAIVKYAVSA